MRTIAIGDIHGCLRSLETLAEYAEFSESDTIVTLGDYVDRGPDSKGVIDFVLALRKRMKVVSLMGNHELMMLAAREMRKAFLSWASGGVGGEETLCSYGGKDLRSVPGKHWKFIQNTLPYHEGDTHFFVHASALADQPLDRQPDFNLYWEKFSDPQPHQSGKVMVCGHTAQKSGIPVNLGHAVCIDTWACGGKWLTGFDVTSGIYWQTNEKGKRRAGEMASLLQA